MRRREADREWKCEKRAATRGAYRVANQQRMAARRALEWIRTSKARLVFRSDVKVCYRILSGKGESTGPLSIHKLFLVAIHLLLIFTYQQFR